MGFFDKLFNKKAVAIPKEYKAALSFNDEMVNLLSLDKYIARSDYKFLIEQYKEDYTFFENMKRANAISYYCKQNKLQEKEVEKFLCCYADIMDIVKGSSIFDDHNNSFLLDHLDKEKAYLDKILYEVDPNIMLDEEQRKVVLSDEDYTLVIAGAGAGKTTTVAAKVRYLVQKKNIDPKQILVISFTNKAVGELRERINEQLAIPCPITTFHKTGNAILRKQDDVKKAIVTEGFLFKTINNYLKSNILEQPELVDKLIMFFGAYFDAPY
ncbi:MAG: UvrD-helicase domain-containing protein, partial [Clostridia bacterium]|nr:UvrD-helicase domain-containing protein [Clostridia bacterium]